jgi:hypothetical protein
MGLQTAQAKTTATTIDRVLFRLVEYDSFSSDGKTMLFLSFLKKGTNAG